MKDCLLKINLLKCCLLAMVTVLIFSSVAQAHHIRGIPHYSYKNNYPETPVYEIAEQDGRWTITFTYYAIPGQKALDLAIYIRDTITDSVFYAPVNFLVFGTREDPDHSHPFTAYRNPTNIYKVGWVYEDEGDYLVRISFDDGKTQHNVLFELSVGDNNPLWMVLIISVSIILIFAIVVGVIRKRQIKTGRVT